MSSPAPFARPALHRVPQDHQSLGHDEGAARKVRAWLLTVLRFAVTREAADRLCVIEAARAIDRNNADSHDPSFSFFVRTSVSLCDAIAGPDHAARDAALRRYFDFIDDRRLRAVLEAATGLRVETPAGAPAVRKPRNLWKGLA